MLHGDIDYVGEGKIKYMLTYYELGSNTPNISCEEVP